MQGVSQGTTKYFSSFFFSPFSPPSFFSLFLTFFFIFPLFHFLSPILFSSPSPSLVAFPHFVISPPFSPSPLVFAFPYQFSPSSLTFTLFLPLFLFLFVFISFLRQSEHKKLKCVRQQKDN